MAVASVGCGVLDPNELLGKADRALDVARRFGDVDLEPTVIASAHGPAAHGVSQHLCDLLSGVARLDALGLPTQEDLDRMLAAAPVA